jgi:hypothetical protein
MENYENIYGGIEDPFENRWKDGVNMFVEEGVLLENDGDWEEVDEDDEEDESEEEEVIKPSPAKGKKARKV